MSVKKPEKVPEKGFYYHYKRDPGGSFNNYAYEVLGVGHHTEDDCRPEDEHMVVYRPIYESSVFTAGKLFDLRPLEMWMGEKTLPDGQTVKRFTKITDPELLKRLRELRDQMYRD